MGLLGIIFDILPEKGVLYESWLLSQSKNKHNQVYFCNSAFVYFLPPSLFAHGEITSKLDACSVVYVNKLSFHDPFILWTREKP